MPDVQINPLTLLNAKGRRIAYGVYGTLGVIGVGVSAYYVAIPSLTMPAPVVGSLAVLGALVPTFSILAGMNVQDDPEPDTDPDDTERANDL